MIGARRCRAGAGNRVGAARAGADWLARHDIGSAKGSLAAARDAARGRLLTLGAGLLAAGALVFTARNFILSREGQVTDRYTKAIEQLGSNELDVRIGGIYALERVARDSAKDHPTIMEVLALEEQRNGEWRYLEFLQVTRLITAEMFLREIPGGTRARHRSGPVDLPEHRILTTAIRACRYFSLCCSSSCFRVRRLRARWSMCCW